MRNDRERLQDILQALEEIEQYTIARKPAFNQDTLIPKWGFVPDSDYR